MNDDSRPCTDVVGGKANTMQRHAEKERGKNYIHLSFYRSIVMYTCIFDVSECVCMICYACVFTHVRLLYQIFALTHAHAHNDTR